MALRQRYYQEESLHSDAVTVQLDRDPSLPSGAEKKAKKGRLLSWAAKSPRTEWSADELAWFEEVDIKPPKRAADETRHQLKAARDTHNRWVACADMLDKYDDGSIGIQELRDYWGGLVNDTNDDRYIFGSLARNHFNR